MLAYEHIWLAEPRLLSPCRKPLGLVKLSDNPINASLSCLPWLTVRNTGFAANQVFGYDPARNNRLLLSSQAFANRIRMKITAYGPANSNAHDDSNGVSVPDAITATQNFSIGCVLLASVNPTSTGSGRAIVNTTSTGFLFGVDSSGRIIYESRCAGEAGPTNKITTTATIKLDLSPNTIIYSHSTGTVQRCWMNGALVAETTDSRALFAAQTSYRTSCAPYTTVGNDLIFMLVCAFWNRALSDGECESFCADPFQLVTPH